MAKTIKAFAHFPKGGSAYATAKGEHAKGALTAAAFIVSGFARLNKGGTIGKTGKGNAALFRALTGDAAIRYWRNTGKIEGDALTVDGVNHLNGRLTGEAPTYRTTGDLISEVVGAMRKGGTVKREGEADWTFNREVAVDA